MEFETTWITHIEGNLWTGGCTNGMVLPDDFKHVISLYPWERYEVKHKIASESYNYMYDADVPDKATLYKIVDWATECIADGQTLIHCQAGLNRSSLIAAMVLIDKGYTWQEAIKLLRDKRSETVLCNPKFVVFLAEYDGGKI